MIVEKYVKFKYPGLLEIEDDVSEILIKVFLNLNQYDVSKSSFNSWVINITKNYMIDKWRNTNISTIPCSYDNMYVTSTTFNALDYLPNNESSNTEINNFDNKSTLSYLSSQLSLDDYMMLDMKYNQGYNYSEIGKQFNLSSTTVSNRVNYLKTKLREDNKHLKYDHK